MELRKNLLSLLYFLAPVILLFIVWEFLSRLEIMNPALISRPSEILATWYSLLNMKSATGQPLLLTYIFSSLYRLAYGFGVAVVSGVGMGLLMGWNRYVYKFLDPLITVAMPIPGIAWTPILILWLGFGDPTIVAVGALAGFFPILYNTAAGVRSVQEKLVWSARSMGADRTTLFRKVYLPSSAPHLFTGLKLGLARAWRTMIAVELIAGTLSGLGYMIFEAREHTQPYKIYGGIIILAVIYLLMETGIKQLEKKSIQQWGMIRS